MTLLDAPVPAVVPTAPDGPRRLFAASGSDAASHAATFGALPTPSRETLTGELERSGLSGRGGAGFPTWRKLASLPGTGAAPALIANGAEGEPLSSKDATLLWVAPHLVIDGLLLVARLIGAGETTIYTGVDQLQSVARATTERSDASGITLKESVDTFISGEASAVVNAIQTGKALPTDRTVRLTTSGLRGRPALVYNVETLAHVALIARYGATWFRSIGTADEPGTRLMTVTSGGVSRVVEAAGGIRLSDAFRAAGFDPSGFRAALVGGYHGAWVPASALDRALSRAELAEFGATPGAGILLGLPREADGLETSAGIARYLANQSARQCGPCLNGLPQIANVLESLASGRADASTEAEVRRLTALVQGRGSCHHPDGTARFVLSSLTVFSADVEQRLARQTRRSMR